MRANSPGSVREEAEHLVASVLAVASLAAKGLGPRHGGGSAGSGFATGGADCCVCPLCRVISAVREPSPRLAERLATGAGDLAAGVASVLRSFAGDGSGNGGGGGGGSGRGGGGPAGPSEADSPPSTSDEGAASTSDPWQAATRADTERHPKPMARKAVRTPVRKPPRESE